MTQPGHHSNNYIFVGNFLKCPSQAYYRISHLHTIHVTLFKDIVPYFDKLMHVYS